MLSSDSVTAIFHATAENKCKRSFVSLFQFWYLEHRKHLVKTEVQASWARMISASIFTQNVLPFALPTLKIS